MSSKRTIPLSGDEVTGKALHSETKDEQLLEHMTGVELEKQLRERLTAKLKSERQEIHLRPVLQHDRIVKHSNSNIDHLKRIDTERGKCGKIEQTDTRTHNDNDYRELDHKKNEKRKNAKKHKQNKETYISEKTKGDRENRYQSESKSAGHRKSRKKHKKKSECKVTKRKRKKHKTNKKYGTEIVKDNTKDNQIPQTTVRICKEGSCGSDKNVINNEDKGSESVSYPLDRLSYLSELERMKFEKKRIESTTLSNTAHDASHKDTGNDNDTTNRKMNLSTIPHSTWNVQEPECHRRVVFKLKSHKKCLDLEDRQSFSQISLQKADTFSRENDTKVDVIKSTGDQQLTTSFEKLQDYSASVSEHKDFIMNTRGNGENVARANNKPGGEVMIRKLQDEIINKHTSLKRKLTDDSAKEKEKVKLRVEQFDSKDDIKSKITKRSLINKTEEDRYEGTEDDDPNQKSIKYAKSNKVILGHRVNDRDVHDVSISKSMDKGIVKQKRRASHRIGRDKCLPEITLSTHKKGEQNETKCIDDDRKPNNAHLIKGNSLRGEVDGIDSLKCVQSSGIKLDLVKDNVSTIPRNANTVGKSNEVSNHCDIESIGTKDIFFVGNQSKETGNASTEFKIDRSIVEYDEQMKNKSNFTNVVRRIRIFENANNQSMKMTLHEPHIKRSRWDKVNVGNGDTHETKGGDIEGRMKEGPERDNDIKQNEMRHQSTTKFVLDKTIRKKKGNETESKKNIFDATKSCNNDGNHGKCSLAHVKINAKDIENYSISEDIKSRHGGACLIDQINKKENKSELDKETRTDTESKSSNLEISMMEGKREIENRKLANRIEENHSISDENKEQKYLKKLISKERLEETKQMKDKKINHLPFTKQDCTETVIEIDEEQNRIEKTEMINQLLTDRKRKGRDKGVDEIHEEEISRNRKVREIKEEKYAKVDLSTITEMVTNEGKLDTQSTVPNCGKCDKNYLSNSKAGSNKHKYVENISIINLEDKQKKVKFEKTLSKGGSGIDNTEKNKNDGKKSAIAKSELSRKCQERNSSRDSGGKREADKSEDSYLIKKKKKEKDEYGDNLKLGFVGGNIRDGLQKIISKRKVMEKQESVHTNEQKYDETKNIEGSKYTKESTMCRPEGEVFRKGIKNESEHDCLIHKKNLDTMTVEPSNETSLQKDQLRIKQVTNPDKESNDELCRKNGVSQISTGSNTILISEDASQIKPQTKKRNELSREVVIKSQSECKSKQSENAESYSNVSGISRSAVFPDKNKPINKMFSDNVSVKRPHDAVTQAIIDDLEAYVLESTAPQLRNGQESDAEKPLRGLKSRFNISITATSLQRITGHNSIDSTSGVINNNCSSPVSENVVGGFPKLEGVGRKVEPTWMEPDHSFLPSHLSKSIENTEKDSNEIKDGIKNESNEENSRKVGKDEKRKKHRSKNRDSSRNHKRMSMRRKRSSSRGRSRIRHGHRRRRRRSRSYVSSSSSTTSLSSSSTSWRHGVDRRRRSKSRGKYRTKRKRHDSPKLKSSVDKRRPAEVRLGIDRRKLRRIAILNMLRTVRPGLTNMDALSTEELKRFQAGGVALDELEEIFKELTAKQERLRAKGAADHIIEAAMLTDEEEVEECRAKAKLENVERAGRDRSDKCKARERLAFNISETVKVVPLLTPSEPLIKREQLLEMFPVSSGIRHQVGDDAEETNHQQSIMNPVPSNETPQPSSAQCMEANTNLGEFTGKVELVPLSQKELQAGIQPWLKKADVYALSSTNTKEFAVIGINWETGVHVGESQFFSAAPVTNSIGQELLKRMGWREGEGLGKNKDGLRQPVLVDIKVDRKGLSSCGETMSKKSQGLIPASQVSNQPVAAAELPSIGVSESGGGCVNKHPVSVLLEHSNKKRWNAPLYQIVHESGPSHSKSFLMSVTINGQVFMPSAPSRSKKEAKLAAANAAVNQLSLD